MCVAAALIFLLSASVAHGHDEHSDEPESEPCAVCLAATEQDDLDFGECDAPPDRFGDSDACTSGNRRRTAGANGTALQTALRRDRAPPLPAPCSSDTPRAPPL